MKTSTGRSVAVVRRERRTVAQRLAHLGIVPVPVLRQPKETAPTDRPMNIETVAKFLGAHMAGAAPRSALK